MKPMIPLLTALMLALPGLAVAEEAGHDDHLATLDGLRLIHAWSRATDAAEALVFFEIENTGATPVTLDGGDCALAQSVEVVGFQLQGETGAYVDLGRVAVAPHGEMELAPERVALRLNGLNAPLRQGESFPMEVHLSLGHVPVHVEVEAADAHQHSHAGHKH